MAATNEGTGEACKHYPVCYTQSILYKLRIEQFGSPSSMTGVRTLYGPSYASLFSTEAVLNTY